MRSLITLGVVSLVGVAGMVACGDDDSGDGPVATAGTGGAGGSTGGTGGTAGANVGGGGTGGTNVGGGGAGGAAPLPPVPTADCTGCVQLTVSNNSTVLVDGATQNQAGYIFVAAPAADPWDLSDIQSITWSIQALTPNAAYFVQPFLQTAPPEDPAYGGAFPPGIPLAPATFPAGEFVDVTIDVAAIGVTVIPNDAGADAGDAGVTVIPVDNFVDAGSADAGVTLSGFDKRFTRFVGLNVGANVGAPLGWVSVVVDSVTVNGGTTTFPNKTFTSGIEELQLNMYQVPPGTLPPAAR